MSGWIKLHRKLTDWEWYSDVNTSRVFLHLLLVANHKDNQWRGIHIKRGQRLTSFSKLAIETNLSIKNIRTAIKRLKSTNEVASYSNAQHTVFTVINYDLYQDEASEVASEGQAKGKQGATNKNVKNDKNEKKLTPTVQPEVKQSKYKFDSYQMEFAVWMHSQLLIQNPNFKKPNLESWANTLRLMLEVDKRDAVKVGEVFTWANNDDFWSSNILSPASLRKQFDKLIVKLDQPKRQEKVKMSGGGDWAKYGEETF